MRKRTSFTVCRKDSIRALLCVVPVYRNDSNLCGFAAVLVGACTKHVRVPEIARDNVTFRLYAHVWQQDRPPAMNALYSSF